MARARDLSNTQHTENQYTSYGYKYNTLQRQREFFFLDVLLWLET